jgi:putative transposase
MKSSLTLDIVLDALLMAVWHRQPTKKVRVHLDQGSQYSSDASLRFCSSHNLEPSMSHRGNRWINAVTKLLFSSLKKERMKRRSYKTRDLAREDIFDYIAIFYDRIRRHTHLGGVSPQALEGASI